MFLRVHITSLWLYPRLMTQARVVSRHLIDGRRRLPLFTQMPVEIISVSTYKRLLMWTLQITCPRI